MRFAGRVLRSVLALLAGVLLALAGVWALAHNAVFTAWLLPLLPGITVVGPQGALLGDFKAARIEVSLPRAGRLNLVEPSWQGLVLRPSASAPWLLGVQAAQLDVRRLDLVWVADPASKPSGAPVDISLPVSVVVQRLQLAQAHSALWGGEPIRQISGALGLQQGAPGQAVHQLHLQSLHWSAWALRGDVQIGVDRGLPLMATLHAEQQVEANQPHGAADVRLTGPLASLQARAALAWQPDAAHAAQSLKAEAALRLFDAWPLTSLVASVNGLNLADLQPGWPRTAWHGRVDLAPTSVPSRKSEPPAAQDVQARLDLRNDLAGPWDAERVPVRQLRGQVSLVGVSQAPDLAHAWREGAVDLVALLPSLRGHDAGQLQVQGGWGGKRVLKASWSGLDAQGLHGQAPPLQLQGALQLSPDWASVPSGATPALGQLRAMVKLDVKGLYGSAFEGEQAGAARRKLPASVPVSLSLDGRYAPDQFEVRTLSLRAQEALADVSQAQFQWGGKAPQPAWSARGRLAIKQFDPQVWLPWPAGMAGRNQLTGEVDMALDARWRGQADVRLAPSLLGGVPLSGQAQWRSPRDSQVMSAMLDLQAGGNTVRAQAEVPWRLGPQGEMRWSPDARWQAQIQAPALQGLQPVAPLLGARQVSGVIEAALKGKGVWPALSTDGQLKVSRLQWVPASGAPMSVAVAQADWALEGLSPDAPLRLNLEVSQWQTAHVLLDKLQWVTSGSLQQHRASLSADLSHKPSGGGKTAVFHVATALQGGWQRQTSTWQGRIGELVATMGGARPRTLLQAQPFDLSWREAPGDRGLHMSATALNVLGAGVQLRTLQWHWQAAPAAQADNVGELELALSLDPLNLPALLASWQPQAGWGGDLLLAGQLTLKHSQSQPWVVDAFVARQSGDITLSEPTIEGNSMQRLGIREARIGLQARDGVWSMNEHFEGRVLGVLKGRQVVQAAAPDRLPEAASPLSGELDLQISNLRPWGTWVPAGWRLTGQMQAKAEVGGTLGVPQYRGQVTGQNLGLGQALLGVNLTEGQLQMDLTGDRVSLTRFVAQGGSQGGRISAQGEALLSEQPTAQLTVKAERFALLQRVDRRIMVSGEARAAFGPEDIKVDGLVQVDEGLIDITRSDAPTVGDDVNVLNRPGQDEEDAGEATSSNGGAPKRKLQADVSVDLGHKLRLKGRGLDAHLAGKLRLSTPGNRPAVNGAVHVENGTFAAYGQKLVIERGDVTFTGPVENPRLDILAMRPQSPTASSSDVQVGVNITGTAQDPRVRLYSDPAMSETEKLSWLVLGRAPTGLGGTDIGLLQSAAVALLSGEGSSPSDNLVAMLGLDELTVRQSDGAVRDTVVNLGKQVSKYWYVGYERNLNATSGNWQLIYRLAKRFTVRAQAGDDNAVDFIWTWKWD